MWIIKQSARLLSNPLPSNECGTKSQLPVFWLCSADSTHSTRPKNEWKTETESQRNAQNQIVFERSCALSWVFLQFKFIGVGASRSFIREEGKCARRGKFIMEEGWFSFNWVAKNARRAARQLPVARQTMRIPYLLGFSALMTTVSVPNLCARIRLTQILCLFLFSLSWSLFNCLIFWEIICKQQFLKE